MALDPAQKRLAEQSRIALQKGLRKSTEERWKFLLKIGLIDKEGPLGVEIQDDAGARLVGFLDGAVLKPDAENIHFGVVFYFHGTLQYRLIRFVR